LAACQGGKGDKKADKAPARDAAAAVDTRAATQRAARDRCRVAADGFVADKTLGTQLVHACAAMFSNPSCRVGLEKAAATPSVEAGMAAIEACRRAYCPTYELAELCESKAPPTLAAARAQFPRLAAEILAAEHGKSNLATLDAAAFLMIRSLLPRSRAIYVRVTGAGAGAVELAIGEDGWTGCKTDKRVKVGAKADLRAIDGPLLGPLTRVAAGVDPALVEVMIDPDDAPRAREVATAAGRFLARRGMDMVICRNERRNCPDVVKCP
jgi:hypothetical protein